MSKKELAKATGTALAVEGSQASDWGEEYVGTTDILIPKILPMQGLSQFVTDGDAVIGEFRDSVSKTKIGSIAEPFVFVPFYVQKTWDILEENDEGEFKWSTSIPLVENPMDKDYNDNLTWQDVVDGVKVKRVRRMNFFGLLPSEIAKGESMPYVLSFKSTSFREGKKMFSQMYMRNKRAGKAPCAYAFVVGGTKEKNEKGTFIVPNVSLGRESTPEEIQECFSWFKTIKKGGVRVDATDDHDAGDMSSPANETGTGEF